jgi:hypothetical protein
VYLALPEKFLDRFKQESLAGLGKKGEGAAIEGYLHWIAVVGS